MFRPDFDEVPPEMCHPMDSTGLGMTPTMGPPMGGPLDPAMNPMMDPMGPMDPAMSDLEQLEARRMRVDHDLEERAAQPMRFHEFASTLTPPRSRSPMAEYMPGIGEPAEPMVMGRHAADFAFERGIPFEHEDHRITSMADDEFMSTLPPNPMNVEPMLQGMHTNEFARQPSLLMEPVSVNPEKFGGGHEPWPEGAIDYVGQFCGRNELEENWHRYSRIGGEHITPEYIANKSADPDWSPVESSFYNYAPDRLL